VTPRWRWHLFCFGLWLHWNAPRPLSTFGLWLVGEMPVRDWFGEGADCGEEVPF
jgi:hypothetical protein